MQYLGIAKEAPRPLHEFDPEQNEKQQKYSGSKDWFGSSFAFSYNTSEKPYPSRINYQKIITKEKNWI